MFSAAIVALSALFVASANGATLLPRSGHQFTFINRCPYTITPFIADTACGYSPRCAGAAHFGDRALGPIGLGQVETVTIPSNWVGRVFAQNGHCGPKGEGCTLGEFNLDTGDQWTPQSYDLSNIQGFTQSIQIQAGGGCQTVTCQSQSCPCSQAYPVGDTSGCGNDSPVRGCGAGDIPFTIVFCP